MLSGVQLDDTDASLDMWLPDALRSYDRPKRCSAGMPMKSDSHPKLYIPRPDVSDRQAFVVVLTVWGESFIDVFLKVGLPSILSPNNILGRVDGLRKA